MSSINGIPTSHAVTAWCLWPECDTSSNFRFSFHLVIPSSPTQTHCFPFPSYLVMRSPFPLPFNLLWEALLFLTSVPFPSASVNSEMKTKLSRNAKLICQLTFPTTCQKPHCHSCVPSQLHLDLKHFFLWSSLWRLLLIPLFVFPTESLYAVFIHNASAPSPWQAWCMQILSHHLCCFESLIFQETSISS